MSGELTPAEATGLVRDLDMLGAHVTDVGERVGGKLGAYIEWLQGQLAERDSRIDDLEAELDAARAEIETAAMEATAR